MQQNNISNLLVNLFLDNKIISFTGSDSLNIIIFMLLIFAPITFAHELLHETAYRLFGCEVKHGFKGL